MPPVRNPSSIVTTSRCVAASASMRGVERLHDPRIPHRGVDAVGGEQVGGGEGAPEHLADADQGDFAGFARAPQLGGETRADVLGSHLAGRRPSGSG